MSLFRRRRRVRHKTYKQVVWQNVRWGLVTLLLAFLALYLVFGGPMPWGGPQQLEVLARDAGALRVGEATKVRVAGVDIGSVKAIEAVPDRPGLTRITVDLKENAPVLRRDATIKIRPRLFLEGNFFLDVQPGTPDAKPLGDRAIPPGAVTIAVASDEVFSAFDAETRENFQQTLKAFGQGLQGGGAKALNRLLKASPPALSEITTVSEAVRGNQDGDLATVVREAGGVLQNLQVHENGLRGTIRQGRRTFDTFAEAQSDLRASIVALDTTTRSLMPQLTRIVDGIPEARALVRDVRPLVRRLPGFLDVANPGLRSLLSLAESRDVQGLTAELRPTLGSLSAVADPLGTLADDLRPVAKCVSDNLLPILNSVVPDGDLTTNLKVYEELGDTFTGLGASTTNFDANGPWVRYLLGLGNQLITTNDGGGTIQAVAENPPVGSTPTPTTYPPLRPDVACETQPVPSLDARMQAFQGQTRSVKIDKDALTKVADLGLETTQSIDDEGAERLSEIETTLRSLLGPERTAADGGAAPADDAATAGAAEDDAAKDDAAKDRAAEAKAAKDDAEKPRAEGPSAKSARSGDAPRKPAPKPSTRKPAPRRDATPDGDGSMRPDPAAAAAAAAAMSGEDGR
jgi:ABC-type transporter Mla subunit MlaD